MKKPYKVWLIPIVLILLLIPVIYLYTKEDNSITYDTTYAVDDLDTSDANATQVNLNDYDDIYKITTGGTYHLTGTLAGQIYIDTQSSVHLILDNVTIKSTESAIYVYNASKTVITLVGTNTLSDGTSRDSEDNAVIYSKDDLTINGSGTLTVNGNYEDGIVSKDILKLISGTYNITTTDDGIRGTDAVMIQDGTFNIKASGCGIKSTNDTDTKLGYIIIDAGTFTINAGTDGIQAVTSIKINNGSYTINSGDDGIQGSSITIEDGTIDITTGGGSKETVKTNNNFGRTTSTTTEKAKGIKADNDIIINNGTITINSADDAIHGNNVTLNSGTYTISASDDAIHAEENLIITVTKIDITSSYEGLEGNKITINSGEININSSDDGMNGSGSNAEVTINDGNIIVNAAGDGIDSNGSIYINGGNTIVNGPTDNGNGSLDYDTTMLVKGGTILASGSSGMLQTPSTTSTVNTLSIVFTSSIINKEITISDASGKVILSYTPTKTIMALVYSSESLVKGDTYTITVGGSTYKTVTISGIVTSIGTASGMGGMRR